MAQHDSDYYLEDGTIVFLVEDTLYRVHRWFFTASPVFASMLTLPPPAGKTVEGTSDRNPIHLTQVNGRDFDCLLWFFYKSPYNKDTPNGQTLSDTWTAVLRIAHMWQFDEIRTVALTKLENLELEAVERVCIAERYELGIEWALDAYCQLCTRPKSLVANDITRLGADTASRVMAIRECIIRGSLRNPHAFRGDRAPQREMIKSMLEGDPETLQSDDGPFWGYATAGDRLFRGPAAFSGFGLANP